MITNGSEVATAEGIARCQGWQQSNGDGWRCRCPGDCDTKASLCVRDVGNNVQLRCANGCNERRIRELLGLPAERSSDRWSMNAFGDLDGPVASIDGVDDLACTDRAGSPDDGGPAWPEIDRFDSPLPEFPVEQLPNVLRAWVIAASHAIQVPADLPAWLALSAMSSLLARRVEISPRPGYSEPVNIYSCVLLPPGNRKSAAFKEAFRPIRDIEKELVNQARPIIARARSERRKMEARLKELERPAGRKSKDDLATEREREELAERLELEPELHPPVLVVNDCTAEKLEQELANQGGRLLSAGPEANVFQLMAGKYGSDRSPNFNVYLMSHAGDEIRTDRLGRSSIHVERPALTCCYVVQPSAMSTLSHEAFRGRGMLGRFLWSAPASWLGSRQVDADPIPEPVSQAYEALLWELHRNIGNIGNDSDPLVFYLSEDAAKIALDWEREIEAMLAEGGELEEITDWGGKLAGATYRLAAIIHACQSLEPVVSADDVRAAISIGRYLVPHAQRVLGGLAGESKAQSDAQYLLRWIERYEKKSFTKSDAQHHGKRRWPKASDIDEALKELTDRGYIWPEPSDERRRGRPSERYAVNPLAFENQIPRKRSQYSQNSSESDQNGNIGNIGNIGNTFQDLKNKKTVRVDL